MNTFNEIIKKTQKTIYNKLDKLVPDNNNVLTQAIRYSLLSKGKRLRPLLVMEISKLFNNCNINDVKIVASAIEMIHTYSLIHDDLPAMDNDDYRRDALTCHKKFTEYDAILAGDSLIPLAFETIITKTRKISLKDKCKIILTISQAIGYKGMCLGQSMDMNFSKTQKLKTDTDAEIINTYKTGYLFKTCVEIGCILGKINTENTKKLIEYSINFGKAFQLMDDLDDNEIKNDNIINVKNTIKNLVDNCLKILDTINAKNKDSIEVLKMLAQFCLKNN